MRGWKNVFDVNGNEKKAGVAILTSDKIDFRAKIVTIDKRGHYIMIKGLIQQEDITTVNIYASNIGAPKFRKQILAEIKREIDRNTITIVDFNTPLTLMERPSRQKIKKETLALNDTLDQMNLIDI